jgi:hypothetical protein
MLDILLTEARGWLADCGMRVPDDTTALLLKVNRSTDGGWPAFVQCDPDASEAAVYAEMELRYPQLLEFLYPQPDPTPTGDPLPIRG